MAQAFSDIVGNEALKQHLEADVRQGTLSHAYLIEGERGFGKHMLALRIAMALSCENRQDSRSPLPCMSCPACRKIMGGNSPDLIYVSRQDKATLGVEAIRGIRSDVLVAPNDFDTKIYVIEEAHLMTEQAQNALLLTLEEPPPYVLFLLLCENLAPMLETVRSRAPVLRMSRIANDALRAHLLANVPEAKALQASNEAELGELIAAADGSIGKAQLLLDPKRRRPILQQRENARAFVRLCTARRQSHAAWVYLSSLPQKRDELIAQFQVTLLCMRDLLLCKQADSAPLCFFYEPTEACSLSYGFTTPELLSLCNALSDATDSLRRNANVRLLLTDFAVRTGLLTLSDAP